MVAVMRDVFMPPQRLWKRIVMDETLGQRLFRLRKMSQLNQSQVAEAVWGDVRQQRKLSSIERGAQEKVLRSDLNLLERFFDQPHDSLYGLWLADMAREPIALDRGTYWLVEEDTPGVERVMAEVAQAESEHLIDTAEILRRLRGEGEDLSPELQAIARVAIAILTSEGTANLSERDWAMLRAFIEQRGSSGND